MAKQKELKQPVAAVADVSFDDLPRRLRDHGREVDEEWLRSVYDFANEQHEGQKRRSGEPYMIHPLSVGFLLADLKFDPICVAVGLLHDVLEDTPAAKATLADKFGNEIADLVDGVSKIGKHEYVRRGDAQAETFRKLILASAKDLRVIVVKLIDRLHNMQTLGHMSKEAQRRIARETLEIYSPIAHRLGMQRVKGELEDLAFFFLYPHQFAELEKKLREKVRVGRDSRRKIRTQLVASMEKAGIDCEISHRTKRYYSIYQKLRRQGIDISELYDYLAFRLITPEVKDCYAALGVVHQNWRPIPGRFKDYIAVPKPNLYQSLHTTVVGEKGQPFEVQIRTPEMELVAEEGIAAHWRYKEGRPSADSEDRGILWLRQLLEWQQEVSDPRAFLNTLKIDLYPEEVYVFTPKGEVLSFPRGATPLDFAYRVHTDLGHQCAGARVSGRLVPLRTPLQTGDIVEIITNPNREPSRDWLKIVATPRARSKIRHWLNTQQKKRAVEIGKTLIEREIRRYRQSARRVMGSDKLKEYLAGEGLASVEDLYGKLGFGKLQPRVVVRHLLTEQQLDQEKSEPGVLRRAVKRILPFGDAPVVVKGHGDLLAFLAKCCKPLPGEEIVGYITRGRGVSVHSAECPNVKNLLYHPEREIKVEWSKEDSGSHEVTLVIEATDAPGLLARLTEIVAKLDSNIRHIEADTYETGKATISMRVHVRDRRHLERIRRALAEVSGIFEVRRHMVSGDRAAG